MKDLTLPLMSDNISREDIDCLIEFLKQDPGSVPDDPLRIAHDPVGPAAHHLVPACKVFSFFVPPLEVIHANSGKEIGKVLTAPIRD